jgi:hypothetical protein
MTEKNQPHSDLTQYCFLDHHQYDERILRTARSKSVLTILNPMATMHYFQVPGLSLLALAMAVTSVSAWGKYHVKFTRFSDAHCTDQLGSSKFIDGKCVDTSNQAFSSFWYQYKQDDARQSLPKDRNCRLVVFDGPECSGEPAEDGDATELLGKCRGVFEGQGQSAMIRCG